jgi:sarcosine oxidase subunit delta
VLLIPCVYCGERPEIEFRYGGQAHLARPLEPAKLSDAEWEAYLFIRANPRGAHRERWRHVHGCGRFFNLLRDTASDRIIQAYEIGSSPPPGESA